MSSTEFKNRVYGCVVVKAINANYNADFNGLPRRLKSDGSFYATDKSFKWLVRNYIKKNHANEKVLFTKQFDDKFSVLTLKQAYEKLDKKDNTLSTLLECIDVRLFGATLADAGNNLSLHGCVQV
ncbi:MAG: type I CRISPR-associated protein Cas7, partial [Arcobacteraceae bacterium]